MSADRFVIELGDRGMTQRGGKLLYVWRVRYRPAGTLDPWRAFSYQLERAPSMDDLQRACAQHADYFHPATPAGGAESAAVSTESRGDV